MKGRVNVKPKRVAVEILLSAAAGFWAYVLPVALDPAARHHDGRLPELVRLRYGTRRRSQPLPY
jgi:hypothetical protein